MSTTTFARQSFTQLWLTLRSNEELGILDSGYIEDFYGDDGFITLVHLDTLVEYQMAMLPVPGATPGIDNDVFEGTLPLAGMDLGLYEVRFRVRDPLGNYSISNSVQNPFGGERLLSLMLNVIEQAFGYVYQAGALIARGGLEIDLSRLPVDVVVHRSPVSAAIDRASSSGVAVDRGHDEVSVTRSHVYVEIT